jgi:hypothetical protein
MQRICIAQKKKSQAEFASAHRLKRAEQVNRSMIAAFTGSAGKETAATCGDF